MTAPSARAPGGDDAPASCPEGHALPEQVFCYECGTHVPLGPALRTAQEERDALLDAAGAYLRAWDRDEPMNDVDLALRLLVKPWAARSPQSETPERTTLTETDR